MDMICARGVITTKLELKYIGVESGGLMQTVSCLIDQILSCPILEE